MAESLFEELKRYVEFGPADEVALRTSRDVMARHFVNTADVFYRRILDHDGARRALEGGESVVGRLKITLVAWMDKLFSGPWDEEYFELRCRIGRMHVRINLPQHYMFGAMNVVREQLLAHLDTELGTLPARLLPARAALEKILDLELAIMLHTYREDLLTQQARTERLATFGQLVGSIGHELRNPLGVIETSLFILKGRVEGDERAQKHVDRIGEQLRLANEIIGRLLDMIRDKPILTEQVAIAKVLDEAVKVAVPENFPLKLEVASNLPALSGDPVQLRQVLVNLLQNAVSVSPAGQPVEVRAWSDPANLHLTVEDRGPGVDPAIRRRLFEPLVTTRARGIGLGLALVKRIMERHGGSVTYEPRDGGGARFHLQLPVGSR